MSAFDFSFILRRGAGFFDHANAYHVGLAAGGTGGTGCRCGRFGSWSRDAKRLPDEAKVALADVASHPAEEAYFLQAGRQDVETMMIYTHVVKELRNPARSPLDIMRERTEYGGNER